MEPHNGARLRVGLNAALEEGIVALLDVEGVEGGGEEYGYLGGVWGDRIKFIYILYSHLYDLHPSVYPFVHPSVRPSVGLFVCPSAGPSVRPSVRQSITQNDTEGIELLNLQVPWIPYDKTLRFTP